MDRGGRYQPIQRRESMTRLRFTKGHVTRGVALASMARSVHCTPSLRAYKVQWAGSFLVLICACALVSRMVGVCVRSEETFLAFVALSLSVLVFFVYCFVCGLRVSAGVMKLCRTLGVALAYFALEAGVGSSVTPRSCPLRVDFFVGL